MTTLLLEDSNAGMRISQDILNKTGIVLLPKGTVLSLSIINYLRKWHIDHIHVEEAQVPFVSEKKKPQKQLSDTYKSTLNATTEIMEALKGSAILKLKEVREVISEIGNFTDITSTLETISHLKAQDKYTYQHNLNVAIYCLFLGRWLELDDTSLKKLTYAGFLHDIGKFKVSEDILHKPDKLNEREFKEIKSHPVYGYSMVKKNPNLSQSIALGILQHHEREDGQGYPFGVEGPKIHLFAKIIAVADVFDAMTSERSYKGKQPPLKVAEELMNNHFSALDQKIVRTFVNRLSDFYIGSKVLLSNGVVGEIVAKNPTSPANPLIKINNEFIDLSADRSITIEDIFM
ncbi:MAG: HD-GYP domain-containing protein [Clostridiaceae bacterium]|nr:HD-GYP domain-containing protein [Clostridiaceae bacterium]